MVLRAQVLERIASGRKERRRVGRYMVSEEGERRRHGRRYVRVSRVGCCGRSRRLGLGGGLLGARRRRRLRMGVLLGAVRAVLWARGLLREPVGLPIAFPICRRSRLAVLRPCRLLVVEGGLVLVGEEERGGGGEASAPRGRGGGERSAAAAEALVPCPRIRVPYTRVDLVLAGRYRIGVASTPDHLVVGRPVAEEEVAKLASKELLSLDELGDLLVVERPSVLRVEMLRERRVLLALRRPLGFDELVAYGALDEERLLCRVQLDA